MKPRALVFGYGFIGAAFADAARPGYDIAATARAPEKRSELTALGITAIDPTDPKALAEALRTATALLITPAPDDDGCPAFAALAGFDLPGKWIGYLSTTGVYGDRGGGWVFEESALLPTSAEGCRRVVAESQWLGVGAQVFRLPGLYGPGRNVIERLSNGMARRIHKPGHVFSRLHHDDCATGLMASLARPRPGGIYNLCDDEPAPADTVLEYAAALTGLPLPPVLAWDDPSLSGKMLRFYNDNKRVSNARAKAELGWRPRFPTYRQGLSAILTSIQAGKKA